MRPLFAIATNTVRELVRSKLLYNLLIFGVLFVGASLMIAQLTTSFGGGWQFLTAAAVLQMALPLAVFIALQRYFVRGVTAGSVKG